MPRIITPESNKRLKREYRLRFLVTLLLSSALAIGLTAVLLMPSYVLLESYESGYANAKAGTQQETLQRINQEYATKLQNTHELSQKISVKKSQHAYVLDTIFAYAGEDISIDALELSNEGNVMEITVRGGAANRSALLAFDEKVQGNSRFSGFELPIEALTKQSDITFNVTFAYHEE
jgi:hypothetical protein